MDAYERNRIQLTGHCITRLKQRFNLGPADYHALLRKVKAGEGLLGKHAPNHSRTREITLTYKGKVITARYNSQYDVIATVF